MNNKYAQDRHRQVGEWVIATTVFEVAGGNYRPQNYRTFCDGAAGCEAFGLPYGLELELDPNNPADRNAIKVIGWHTKRCIFGRKTI